MKKNSNLKRSVFLIGVVVLALLFALPLTACSKKTPSTPNAGASLGVNSANATETAKVVTYDEAYAAVEACKDPAKATQAGFVLASEDIAALGDRSKADELQKALDGYKKTYQAYLETHPEAAAQALADQKALGAKAESSVFITEKAREAAKSVTAPKPSSNVADVTNPSNSTGSGSGGSSGSNAGKTWVPARTIKHPAVYKTVHHDAVYKTETVTVPAVTETVSYYKTSDGKIFDNITDCDAYMFAMMHAGTPVSCTTLEKTIVVTPATTTTRKVLVTAAYDEQVLVSAAWTETVPGHWK